jgi:hypothetical protein
MNGVPFAADTHVEDETVRTGFRKARASAFASVTSMQRRDLPG